MKQDYATQKELKKEFLKYKQPEHPDFSFKEFIIIASIAIMGFFGTRLLFSI